MNKKVLLTGMVCFGMLTAAGCGQPAETTTTVETTAPAAPEAAAPAPAESTTAAPEAAAPAAPEAAAPAHSADTATTPAQ